MDIVKENLFDNLALCIKQNFACSNNKMYSLKEKNAVPKETRDDIYDDVLHKYKIRVFEVKHNEFIEISYYSYVNEQHIVKHFMDKFFYYLYLSIYAIYIEPTERSALTLDVAFMRNILSITVMLGGSSALLFNNFRVCDNVVME